MAAEDVEERFHAAFDAAALSGPGDGALEERLGALLEAVRPADREASRVARERWDSVAKPLGGLGLLEEAVTRMAGAQGTPNVVSEPRALAIFIADNGVVAEGVSQSGQDVTWTAAHNMAAGAASVCRMARVASCAVVPVDVGMARELTCEGLYDAACVRGTADIACGPAMSRPCAIATILAGATVARLLAEGGARLLAAGEMGIGNTTTSAAVACALLGIAPEDAVGRGAGLSNEGLRRKRAVVSRALAANIPDHADPVGVLASVGCPVLCSMCGYSLVAASSRCAAVLDGVISCTAAAAACALRPDARDYLLASHCSSEPAARLLLGRLGLSAPLEAGMHLGEGTGAVALMPLLDQALAVYRDAATFDESGLDAYQELS